MSIQAMIEGQGGKAGMSPEDVERLKLLLGQQPGAAEQIMQGIQGASAAAVPESAMPGAAMPNPAMSGAAVPESAMPGPEGLMGAAVVATPQAEGGLMGGTPVLNDSDKGMLRVLVRSGIPEEKALSIISEANAVSQRVDQNYEENKELIDAKMDVKNFLK